MEKGTKKLSNTDWIAISILGIGIIGMVGLPYLITKQSWLYDLGVKDANEIGDTLGGILGPFISLISAFLVYLALREQIIANQKFQDHFEIERKEKFEKTIFDETLLELNSILEEYEYTKHLFQFSNNGGEKYSFEDILENIIFENTTKAIDINLIEKYKNLFLRTIECLYIIKENIKQEKSFLTLSIIRIRKISSFITSENIRLIKSPVLRKIKENNFLDLNNSGSIDLLLSYYKLEYEIQLRLNGIDSADVQKDTIIWLEDVIEDINRLAEFKHALNVRQQEILYLTNELNTHAINQKEFEQKMEILNHVSYKDLDSEFEIFISNLKSKGIYNLN